ncbi:hypothetical protein CAEBREN_12098 [Caenorhabditis brenneri]|uniref:Uncharacterized protein n=1 Tax=Caenorhabditis brenneri TaxID=135651 RepID=G0MMQ7_CAEBE|nr:hypothetical protein CAEBREN_12098 [Caenorhabditis brenneri]
MEMNDFSFQSEF